jgi:hypothetical protein
MTSAPVRNFLFLILVLSCTFYTSTGSESKNKNADAKDTIAFRSPFFEDNERCFKCHGQNRYEYTNENLGRQVKAMMFSERIIDKNRFYESNHKGFSCTDCHSGEYVKFPHSGELRMEQMYNCIDCHGNDEKFARFNFELHISSVHILSLKMRALRVGNAMVHTITK